MSHFTKIKTMIREKVVLCEALQELHHQFREGENLSVRGYQGNTETAEVVVTTGCSYDIGFQRQGDGTFGAVADWDWGILREAGPQFQRDGFLSQVHQKCAHISVKNEARERGFIIEEERVLENGEIELVVVEPA